MFDSDGVLDSSVYEDNVAKNANSALLYDGGEGDDEIWMLYGWDDTDDEPARLYGGNGDDIIKHGYDNEDGMLIVG